MARTASPEGRTVVLDAVAWAHVPDRHPAMTHHLDAVMRTIERPEFEQPDPRPGQIRYFARGGPQRWLRVVVELAGAHDRVVAAFPQGNDPS